MSRHWVIDSVEIENPYRYRGYFVGRKPIFDTQNDTEDLADHGKVVRIDEDDISDFENAAWMITVIFEDGERTSIQNGPGCITSGHSEVRDDTN